MEEINGILNVVKPVGISSFTFMRKVQRKLSIKKVGHLGTLDPNACGVLVLLCGKYTKWAEYLHGRAPHPGGKTVGKSANYSKVYRSVFTFGTETDTLDTAGKIIKKSDIIPTAQQIIEVIKNLTGDIEIEIPKFSAIHIKGQRAYELARSNIEFTSPKKTVKIFRFELLKQIAVNKFFIEVECETGTYVRSLAKLVAERLNTVAIASSILRTRVSDFDISTAKCLRDIQVSDLITIQ